MLRVEIVDQRRAVAKQHAEDYILPYPYAFALKRTGSCTISQVGVVVFGTEVTKEKVPDGCMPDVVDEFGTFLVAHVPPFATHSLLKIGRIWAIHQHVDVVVGLDNQMIGKGEIMTDIWSYETHIGGQAETHHLVAISIFDVIADIVG